MVNLYFTDPCEASCLVPLQQCFLRNGVQATLTDDLSAPASLGIYACHSNLLFDFKAGAWRSPRNHFSVFVLHDLYQDGGLGAEIFATDSLHIFDLALLPGDRWVDIYNRGVEKGFRGPRLGCAKVGWPKSDLYFKTSKEKPRSLAVATNLKQVVEALDPGRKTILIAASWTSTRIVDACQTLFDADEFNVIFKLPSERAFLDDDNPWAERFRRQTEEMTKVRRALASRKGVIVSPDDIDIFTLLSTVDGVLSNGSNVMFEAAAMGIASVCIREWEHPAGPKGESSRNPMVDLDGLYNGSERFLVEWARHLVRAKSSFPIVAGGQYLIDPSTFGTSAERSVSEIVKHISSDPALTEK